VGRQQYRIASHRGYGYGGLRLNKKDHLFLGLLQGRSEARQGWSRPTCLNSSYSSLNLQKELKFKTEGPFMALFDLEFDFEGALVERSSMTAYRLALSLVY
jgi:hypothetical protein